MIRTGAGSGYSSQAMWGLQRRGAGIDVRCFVLPFYGRRTARMRAERELLHSWICSEHSSVTVLFRFLYSRYITRYSCCGGPENSDAPCCTDTLSPYKVKDKVCTLNVCNPRFWLPDTVIKGHSSWAQGYKKRILDFRDFLLQTP